MAAATIQVNPPKEFDFKDINGWPRWLQRFQQYLTLIGKKNDKEECDLLLYCMGEVSLKVLNQIGKTEDYEALVKKFNDYFNPRRNIIFERAQFNRRKQMLGESADDFIKSVYKLADNCQLENMTKNEIIRDKLVVGINDKSLAEKMQMKKNLL